MLEVNELKVVYPNGTEALKSISINAQRGEIIAVIGRSGAGKSTLLRCINGLQKPTSGQIILDGENITAMNNSQLRNARCHIGFIWQEYNLVERLPALTNVLTGRLGHNRSLASLVYYFDRGHREIALRSLERVNLMHRAQLRADQLSGGEKQRVAIARAIAQQPKIILADEPVASLDPELSVQVMSDLARVAREDGVLTLINIHHVELAKEFTDRLIGIAQGMVVYDGAPDGLTDEIMHRIYRFDADKALPHEKMPSLEPRSFAAQQPLVI
ncbi:MAG: phosphonate ABC transporter ATP-binding protein [Burkholderiales bacterium]|nr:phosphonate ABC transporter ATP-binding protein [Anaerolineae bacterium]